MVEADEQHPVDGVRRRNKARDPIDGEVSPFRLLNLDEETHLLAVRPVKHCAKCRDPCPGKALMKPGSRIETADPSRLRSAAKPWPSVVRSTVRSCRMIGSPSAVSTTSISTIVAPQDFAAWKAGSVFSG